MSLTERFIKYLERNTHVSDKWQQSTTVTKQKLQSLALENGYTASDIKTAFKELDEVVYIGNWWDPKKRVVEYIFYPMTDEEIKMRENDLEWFDSLPEAYGSDKKVCLSKAAYWTEKAAESTRKKQEQKAGIPLKVYKCPVPGKAHWHLTKQV